MNKFIIKNLHLNFYCGLYEIEKKNKNSFVLNFEYYTDEFIDYSKVYSLIIDTVNKKKWNTLEDLSVYLIKEIKNEFPLMKKIKIIIEKLNPLNMPYCESVIFEYEE